MSDENIYDVVIVGGGPAGLSAAIWLGRYLHSVALIDSGDPRNWETHGINGYLGLPGIRPAQLRGGWALWTTGSHLWTRSPAGQVRLAASGSATSKWVMGGDGTVLLLGGPHAYLAGPPYAGLVDVGPTFVYWSWHRGHFYAPWGIEVFQVGG